ncbi:MAG: shikimate dehydrogenase [Alphaproteobacteria bacterium]|nr:shikimate dehydrogenase [Alphaproteobacteria bacterium]MBU0858871.1 shikimate dehydrogenase [Alphaproteobacteria bacterium]
MMLHAALIGHPVIHSLSPAIHTYWMDRHGVEGAYGLIDTAGQGLPETIKDMVAQNYNGFNVTLPHKQAVMDFCDHVDDTARLMGAVNTVHIRDGKCYGSNTDAYGFVQSLLQADPEQHYLNGRIVVLGAGGAARAVVYGLREAGAKDIIVCNRTLDRAKGLSAHICPWEERSRILAGAALLVNTTSLGMQGQDKLDIDLAALPATALVCDIVYKPRETKLLQAAAAQGCRTVDGLGMLLQQAARAFSVWTGITPEITDELRDMLKARTL